jgi:hypothetical protein
MVSITQPIIRYVIQIIINSYCQHKLSLAKQLNRMCHFGHVRTTQDAGSHNPTAALYYQQICEAENLSTVTDDDDDDDDDDGDDEAFIIMALPM